MNETRCDALAAAFAALTRLRAALPFRPLSIAERREHGGRLFPAGPALVVTVGRALCSEPTRFAAERADGTALLEKQRRALRLRFLRDGLLRLAQLAGDGYLLAQSEAICEAQAILQRDQLRLPLPGESQAAAERTLLLVPGHRIHQRYHRVLQHRRHRAKRQPAAATRDSTAAVTPGPASTRDSTAAVTLGQQQTAAARAAATVTQSRRAALSADFRAVSQHLGAALAAALPSTAAPAGTATPSREGRPHGAE